MAAPPARRKRKKPAAARPAVRERVVETSGPPVGLIAGGIAAALLLVVGIAVVATRGTQAPAVAADEPPAPPAEEPEVIAGQPQGKTQLSRRTREVLNLKELTDPAVWRVADRDETPNTAGESANPLEYISTVQGAGFSAIKTIGTVISPIAQWVRQEQIVNERTPTHADVVEYVEQNNLWLPAMRPWQHYAYDEDEGKLLVVDNLEERDAAYIAGGLDPPEE
ncbi:MAG: hypothetical protein AAF532_16880 [Planctomycetota bacterium]